MKIKNLKTVAISGTILLLLTSATVTKPGDKETKVRIHTTKGDMVVELYNETPQTRDNFIKLIKNKTYDSTLFSQSD